MVSTKKLLVTAIMILYKNTKVIVCLSDGDTDFFDIGSGDLQVDILVLFIFTICQV